MNTLNKTLISAVLMNSFLLLSNTSWADTNLCKAIKDLDLKAVKKSIETNVDINKVSCSNEGMSTLNTVLPLAGMEMNNAKEILEILLANGASPNVALNKQGTTPMMMAATFGNSKLVKKLMQYGGNLNIQDNAGRSAYDYAETGDNPDVLSDLK